MAPLYPLGEPLPKALAHPWPPGSGGLDTLLHEAVFGRPGELLVGGRLLALTARGASGIFHALADKAGLGGAVKLFGCGLRLALQLGCVVRARS